MRPWVAVPVSLVLVAAPAWAKGHGGGHGGSHGGGHGHAHGGGSHASSAGRGHAHHTGSHASSHTGRHHVSPPSSDGGSATPRTEAQRRHPRPGTGTGERFSGRFSARTHVGLGLGLGLGLRRSYPRPFVYDYLDYGDWPWSMGGQAYVAGVGGPYDPREVGALRILVDPDKTRVYVDGDYAGIADDFDGIFQRLRLPAGEHEIMLRLEGYRTRRFEVLVPARETRKIHYRMVPGDGEDFDQP